MELTANANDAQLVEARNQSILDSANMVGVPGNAVGAPNTSRTYTNTELQALEYIKTSLRPLVTRIEQAMSTLLPNGSEAKMSYDALLRPDTLTRYQAHQIALQSGFLTIDEVRQLENREELTIETNEEPQSARELAEIIQKIYLGVGKVVTSDEARAIINRAGADLKIPEPDLPTPTTGGVA
jgi:phage portal protein BeeE